MHALGELLASSSEGGHFQDWCASSLNSSGTACAQSFGAAILADRSARVQFAECAGVEQCLRWACNLLKKVALVVA